MPTVLCLESLFQHSKARGTLDSGPIAVTSSRIQQQLLSYILGSSTQLGIARTIMREVTADLELENYHNLSVQSIDWYLGARDKKHPDVLTHVPYVMIDGTSHSKDKLFGNHGTKYQLSTHQWPTSWTSVALKITNAEERERINEIVFKENPVPYEQHYHKKDNILIVRYICPNPAESKPTSAAMDTSSAFQAAVEAARLEAANVQAAKLRILIGALGSGGLAGVEVSVGVMKPGVSSSTPPMRPLFFTISAAELDLAGVMARSASTVACWLNGLGIPHQAIRSDKKDTKRERTECNDDGLPIAKRGAPTPALASSAPAPAPTAPAIAPTASAIAPTALTSNAGPLRTPKSVEAETHPGVPGPPTMPVTESAEK